MSRINPALFFILPVALLLPAYADEQSPGKRSEVTLIIQSWPALADLRPEAGGSFDAVGYGLAGAMHWPVKRFRDSELLLGFDVGITSSQSSTPGVLDELLARRLFVSPSIKWMFGDTHRFSLGAGIGWHLLDMAEASSGYGGTGSEIEYWEDSIVAPYVGATWDVKAGATNMAGAFSVGLKVHFVDFGSVHDQGAFLPPTLGPSAGDLSGPIIVLQLGSAWR